ncbi:MAG: hypothetical protein MZV65_21670 [Chromatiales bacterium]|nr:hypothetical protein [Chromatiales bacterium]
MASRLKCRWIHPEKQRYYSVALVRDLFGDWTLLSAGEGSAPTWADSASCWVESREAGLKQIAAIGKRRRQHGYREQERICARPEQRRITRIAALMRHERQLLRQLDEATTRYHAAIGRALLGERPKTTL